LSCANTAEPIEMRFGADLREPKEPLLDGGQYRTNPFATARGDKTEMRPLAKLLLDSCYWFFSGETLRQQNLSNFNWDDD